MNQLSLMELISQKAPHVSTLTKQIILLLVERSKSFTKSVSLTLQANLGQPTFASEIAQATYDFDDVTGGEVQLNMNLVTEHKMVLQTGPGGYTGEGKVFDNKPSGKDFLMRVTFWLTVSGKHHDAEQLNVPVGELKNIEVPEEA